MPTLHPEFPVVTATGRKIDGRTEYRLVFGHTVDLPGFDPVIIPSGFRTDLASIPAILASWLPHDEPAAILAGIPHDWLYRTADTERWSRWACDAIFREILIQSGMRFVTAWLCWAAVRLFGRRYYVAIQQQRADFLSR